MDFLKREFSNLPLSSMHESGDNIFSCDYIRNCQYNGWFSEQQSNISVLMTIINIIHHIISLLLCECNNDCLMAVSLIKYV